MAEGKARGRARSRARHRRARPLRHLALSALLASLSIVASGCVRDLSVDDAGCPCASGYKCCPVENRCLPIADTCPVSRNCPVPPLAVSDFELGTTDGMAMSPVFLPLPAGGHLPLNHGQQGGYHVYIQVRFAGLDPASLTLARYLFDPAETVHDKFHALRYQISTPDPFCDHDTDWLLLDDQTTYVCPTPSGEKMYDRDLVLRLEATDREGRALTGEWTIHPDCPPGDATCTSDSAIGGCAARN